MIPRLIISGGQTGADQGGLEAAKELGIETAGYAPKGWLTEDGRLKDLLVGFGLKECPESGYPARTKYNVRYSDATLIFGFDSEPGSKLTRRLCEDMRKPFLVISQYHSNPVPVIREWLALHDPVVLNIAGNRESKHPGIFAFTKATLIEALREGAVQP